MAVRKSTALSNHVEIRVFAGSFTTFDFYT